MSLLNTVKKRPGLVALMFLAGLFVGGAVRPAILSYAAREVTNVREAVSVEVEAPSLTAETKAESISQAADAAQAEAQGAPVANVNLLAPRPETVPLTVDQSQIDWDNLDTYQGMPAGFTAEGYPYLGDPQALVTFEEYSDFLCPFCGRHFNQTVPTLLDKYVQTGQVLYVFRDLPLVGLHPTAPQGHVAARCVAEQGPALFWLMHDELFKRQNEWSQLPDPRGYLTGLAQALGVDPEAYQECLASGEKDAEVQDSIAAGQALNFNGTPSFQFIQHDNDETYTLVGAHPADTFSQWLDALVAGEVPPVPEEPEPDELPFWANDEGLTPDPDRPGFTLAGDAYKGNPEADLVVVEFADFQCDSCRRHALETQPTVDEQFIETGEIMWVFKSLPLKEHAHAPAAAVAAECAGEQGQFWDMHQLLFENLAEWSTATDPDSALIDLAEPLALDMDQYSFCFNSRQALERIVNDMHDAQGVVEQTPTFIFLSGGRGSVSTGVIPADQFVRRLEGLLEQARAGE